MTDNGKAIKVFVSYSQDNEEHSSRVRRLSDRLRNDGVDCQIDQYEIAPAEGWRRWMDRRIAWADFVLVICTETYHRRARGEEAEGQGLGATYEASQLLDLLYAAGMRNERTIPILFEGATVDDIPLPLRSYSRYHLEEGGSDGDHDQARGYEDLYRHLTGQPRVVAPDLGKVRRLDPEPSPSIVDRPMAARPAGPTRNTDTSPSEDLPPDPSPPEDPPTKDSKSSRALPIALAAMLLVTLLYFGFLRPQQSGGQQPLVDVFAHLEEHGYSANRSLGGSYVPGDVLQTREPDPGSPAGPGRPLATPLSALRAEECFPDLEPGEAPFPLPQSEGTERASLGIDSSRLLDLFPTLVANDEAVLSYRLTFDRPRVRSHAKLDLSGQFAPSCVEKLQRALGAGDAPEWYETVVEVVEAQGLSLEMRWEGGLEAEAKTEVQEKASQMLTRTAVTTSRRHDKSAPVPEISLDSEDERSTLLRVEVPVVLGYRTRPMDREPRLAQNGGPPLLATATAAALVAQEDSEAARASELEDLRGVFLDPDAERLVGRLALRVQQSDGSWQRTSIGQVLPTGSRFRFEIETTREAALFVFQRPPEGETTELWPAATGNPNLVAPGEPLLVPPPAAGFEMGGTLGDETFFVALVDPETAGLRQGPETSGTFVLRGLGHSDTRGLGDAADPWLYFESGEGMTYLATVAFSLEHDE